MDPNRFDRHEGTRWEIAPRGAMRVPAVIFADEALIEGMDDKVFEQLTNVATLPGIVQAAYAMPDAHWGYGFPIGGVAAFDPDEGGVISAGGVGFDISCGVRTLLTGLRREDIDRVRKPLADALFRTVPAGVGSTGHIRLDASAMDAMLRGGAAWAVEQGWGDPADLERIEEHGRMAGADPDAVSEQAKRRQRDEMGTLGSGNHYLEVQHVAKLYRAHPAAAQCLPTSPGSTAWPRATWWSASTAVRAGSVTRSAPSSCATCCRSRASMASRCRTVSFPARRSVQTRAGATWARCAPRSTARWPTARSSPT